MARTIAPRIELQLEMNNLPLLDDVESVKQLEEKIYSLTRNYIAAAVEKVQESLPDGCILTMSERKEI